MFPLGTKDDVAEMKKGPIDLGRAPAIGENAQGTVQGEQPLLSSGPDVSYGTDAVDGMFRKILQP